MTKAKIEIILVSLYGHSVFSFKVKLVPCIDFSNQYIYKNKHTEAFFSGIIICLSLYEEIFSALSYKQKQNLI
jgi:hypothetical protein